MLSTINTRRLAAWLAALMLALPAFTLAASASGLPMVQVVQTAACDGNKEAPPTGTTGSERLANPSGDDCEADGLQGFVKAADALVSPAIVAMAAITPIACILGAGALMFGNRRGLPIIGSALGALVFVISVKGIVA